MGKYKTLSPHDFRKYLAQEKKSLLLDIRSMEKGKPKNGIYGAKHLDFFSGSFELDINKCDKSCPVFIYCQTGEQSERACQFMEKAGFKYLFHLKGGLDAYLKVFGQRANNGGWEKAN